jgi:hypothetical protein
VKAKGEDARSRRAIYKFQKSKDPKKRDGRSEFFGVWFWYLKFARGQRAHMRSPNICSRKAHASVAVARDGSRKLHRKSEA